MSELKHFSPSEIHDMAYAIGADPQEATMFRHGFQRAEKIYKERIEELEQDIKNLRWQYVKENPHD